MRQAIKNEDGRRQALGALHSLDENPYSAVMLARLARHCLSSVNAEHSPRKKGSGETEFYRLLGERLRVMRVAHSLSQERLAQKLGLTFQQIQKYEKGLNAPSLWRLLQFAALFDVSLATLISPIVLGEVEPDKIDAAKPMSVMDMRFLLAVNALSERDRDIVRGVVRLCSSPKPQFMFRNRDETPVADEQQEEDETALEEAALTNPACA